MKVLNLYSGLGGNRKYWQGVEVTAVELDESIAKFYADRFPDDTVIVGDAHQYLIEHYNDGFDLIWSSVPCPSHSRARYWKSKGGGYAPVYPDMSLYQEIIFLKHFYNGQWVVENVNPYYTPLIREDAKIGRHLFWSNFEIARIEFPEADIQAGKRSEWETLHGFSLKGYKFNQRTDKILRNCVHPDLGLHIFNESQRVGLFQMI